MIRIKIFGLDYHFLSAIIHIAKTIVLEMGTISTDTKLGIVTLVDDEYIYVWSVGFGGLELRYPLNPEVQFEVFFWKKYKINNDILARRDCPICSVTWNQKHPSCAQCIN